MSLDLYLDQRVVRYGGPEPAEGTETVVSINITYNLAAMLRDVGKAEMDGGIWEEIRRREEGPASELKPAVEYALRDFRKRREELKAHESPNGWGTLEWAEEFLVHLAEGCAAFPNATVRAWR